MKEVLRLKRLANRKLYNTSTSTYMSLDEVFDFAMTGGDVSVIDVQDKKDKKDVTVSVLVRGMAKKIDREPDLMVIQHLRQILKCLNEGMYSKWIVAEEDGE